jgi:hypothetical protein
MNKLTPKERLEIYKKMLVYLKEDRQHSLKHNYELYGLCWALNVCTYDHHNIKNFPELMAIRPRKTFDEDYWWTTDPNSTTRIDMIQEIIERMEKKLIEKHQADES